MARIAHALPVFCVCLLAGSQSEFQGVITFRLRLPSGLDGALVQTTKGENVRSDVSGPLERSLIVNRDAHAFVMLMPAMRVAMRVPFSVFEPFAAHAAAGSGQEGGEAAGSGASAGGRLIIVPANRSDTVAGTGCEVYHVTAVEDTASERTLCVASAPGLSTFLLSDSQIGTLLAGHALRPATLRQFRSLLGRDRHILKIASVEHGVELVQLEAIKIELRPVSDDVFEVPAGYQEQTLRVPNGFPMSAP